MPLGVALSRERTQDRRVFINIGRANPGRGATLAPQLLKLVVDPRNEFFWRLGRRCLDGRRFFLRLF